MTKRSISDSTRAWLLGELETWRNAGVVSAEQTGQILNLYESSEDAARRKHSGALFALMGVAALLIGAAVLLLIGYNWEDMSAAAKLAVIFGAILGTHGLGLWLRYRRDAGLLSEIAFFLGCLFYGCGIWLVAQIFHINSHYPDGLWYWALGVLPFALCLDTLLLHALVVGLLAAWVGTETLGFDHFLRPLLFGRWFAVPGACYTLPLLALPGLLWAYRKQSPAVVGLYVPLLAWWAVLQPIAWQCDVNPVYFIGAAGAFLLMLAECHPNLSPMAVPYRFYGVALAAGALVPLTFAGFNAGVCRGESPASSVVAGIAIAIAGTAAIVVGDRWRPRRDKAKPSNIPFREILARQWLPVGLILLMAGLCWWNSLVGLPATSRYDGHSLDRWTAPVVLPTLATNAAMVVFAIWLMRLGLREDRTRPFTAGVGLFLLWTILRYADLFGDMGGMLGASLMFFICGASLFAVARFWMHRKEVAHV
jgi:hypothetical protein